MNSRKIVFFLLCFLICLCAFSFPSYALKLTLSVSNLPDGITGPVEIFRQVGKYDPPNGGDDVKEIAFPSIKNNKLSVILEGVEKDAGKLNGFDQETILYVRIWDGAVGKKHSYARSESKTIAWQENNSEIDWNIASWKKFIADAPKDVGVRVNRELLERFANSQSLILDISAVDSNQTEILNSRLEVSKYPFFKDVKDSSGGQKQFDSANAIASGSYFTSGTYYIRAQKSNHFGATPAAPLVAPIYDITKPGDSVLNAVARYKTLGAQETSPAALPVQPVLESSPPPLPPAGIVVPQQPQITEPPMLLLPPMPSGGLTGTTTPSAIPQFYGPPQLYPPSGQTLPSEIVLSKLFKKPAGKTGINTFSIPFEISTAKNMNNVFISISTVENLITEINRQGRGQKVSAFGWFDPDNQRLEGLVLIHYTASGIDRSNSLSIRRSVLDVLHTAVEKDFPYQVTVSEPISFQIKGRR